MRSMRRTTPAFAWPSLRSSQGRLVGLPFVLASLGPGFVFGWQVCIAALVIATLANFLVYVPVTALALNGGDALAENAPAPSLTRRAYAVLLVLWTVTAWSGALAAQLMH